MIQQTRKATFMPQPTTGIQESTKEAMNRTAAAIPTL
jgi:hypothetical protein